MSLDVAHYYEKYGPMVLRRCRRLLGDEDEALDAMQETFVKVLVQQGRLEDRAPSSLLYRVATNVCLNRIRTKKRHPEDRDEELLLSIATHGEEERSFARRVLRRLFEGELESTQVMAVLHYVDGMTLEEVAQAVGFSVSGVRKRLRKLRQNLRALDEMVARPGARG